MSPFATMRGWTSVAQHLLQLTLTVAERRIDRSRPATPAPPIPDPDPPIPEPAPAPLPFEDKTARPRAAQRLLRQSYDSTSRWLHEHPKPRLRQLLWQLAIQVVALTAAFMTAWIERHLA